MGCDVKYPAIHRHGRNRERGAVLYVTLIMLILMAMLGIVGMQVVGLQEKMAANFRASSMAFQNAEQNARRIECAIEDQVNNTSTAGCGVVPGNIQSCDFIFDAGLWAKARIYSDGPSSNVRSIGSCISGNSSIAMGNPVNEDPNPIYQVTAYAADRAPGDSPSSDAVIDTIFRP